MAELAQIGGRIGPRLVWVRLASCEGCPALRLRTEEDNGAYAGRVYHAAYCNARPDPVGWEKLGTLITPYWRVDRAPPAWCPGNG